MCPHNITAKTDPGSDSVTVNFTMRFADNVDSHPEADCDHTSGSSFAFGETTVVCTVVDSSNNAASCNFSVHVTGKLSNRSGSSLNESQLIASYSKILMLPY